MSDMVPLADAMRERRLSALQEHPLFFDAVEIEIAKRLPAAVAAEIERRAVAVDAPHDPDNGDDAAGVKIDAVEIEIAKRLPAAVAAEIERRGAAVAAGNAPHDPNNGDDAAGVKIDAPAAILPGHNARLAAATAAKRDSPNAWLDSQLGAT